MLAAVRCQFARADVVFVVDSSRTICGGDSRCANFGTILSFVNDIIRQLNVGQDNTRIGFVRYSSPSATSNEFYLNDQYDRTRVQNAVTGVQYNTGRANVADLVNALEVARTQQFVSTRGDRLGAPNIIVVLTNTGIQPDSPTVSLQSFITSRFTYIIHYSILCLLITIILNSPQGGQV